MAENKDRLFLSTQQVDAVLLDIASQIHAECTDEFALVGIRSRGVPLAKELAEKLKEKFKKNVKVGILDINLYRDDLTEVSDQPILQKTEIGFPIQSMGIILVDDVLYTGRTIRAAMDALIDYGRPRYIKLAALVDRGWRELPIEANFVGKKIKTSADEVVKVMCKEIDGKNEVWVKSHFNKRT